MRRGLPQVGTATGPTATGWLTGLLVAVALALTGVIGGALAAAVPLPRASADPGPRITRLFIPAIKQACRDESGVPPEADIGYTFRRTAALVTIDRDGRLTGLGRTQLRALNDCLGRYRIDAIELPRGDRLTRSLLYDYYQHQLQPCLEYRVDGLPDLPDRDDFLERLVQWLPYRSIVAGRSLEELLELARECPELPTYLRGA